MKPLNQPTNNSDSWLDDALCKFATGYTRLELLESSEEDTGLDEYEVKEELEAVDKLKQKILQKMNEAEINGLRFGLQQLTGLDKSHVGRSFYNRNTAFKNYAVKFWNNRMEAKRSKLLDRIESLEREE